jgi:hypothetical protein
MKYSVIVTSCDRHDLLLTTLRTFFASVGELLPFKVFIVEDSNKTLTLPDFGCPIEVIQHGQNKGLRNALITGYEVITKTRANDFLLHLEDDWLFDTSRKEWLLQAFEQFKSYPDAGILQLRKQEDNPHKAEPNGLIPIWVDPWGHTKWFGYTNNPHLMTMKLAKDLLAVLKSYESITHENQYGNKLYDLGYRFYQMQEGICIHNGYNRSKI